MAFSTGGPFALAGAAIDTSIWRRANKDRGRVSMSAFMRPTTQRQVPSQSRPAKHPGTLPPLG